MWELLEDVDVVQDELSEVLDVIIVVATFADLVEELVLGEAVLRELRVVEMERLTVLEVAADVLRRVDVVAEMLMVEKVLSGAFDVVLVHKEMVRAECDMGKEWSSEMVRLPTRVVF